MKHLREKQKLSVKISATRDEAVTITKNLPDQEAIDAFVLNYRFFTQKRDRSSFRQLSKVYEKLPISEKLKLEFCDARQLLNKLLDQKISITIKNETPSRRELIDVFLYGCLAHAEPPKKEIFDEWSKNSIAYAFMEAEFCDTLQRVLRIILHVSQINEKVIKELENNSPTL